MNNKDSLIDSPTSSSITNKSLDNLLKILPSGILSKNSFIGAKSKLIIMFLCRNLAFYKIPISKTFALKLEKTPINMEKAE